MRRVAGSRRQEEGRGQWGEGKVALGFHESTHAEPATSELRGDSTEGGRYRALASTPAPWPLRTPWTARCHLESFPRAPPSA